MRVAVFTNRFFARDLRALADAGVAVEVFAVRPDERRRAAAAAVERRRSGVAMHHLTLRDSARLAAPLVGRQTLPLLRDGAVMLASAVRRGMGSLARTAYVLPKAWAWAARAGERFDHVLAYHGDHVGACAYAFHRLLPRPVPFTLWVHTRGDLHAPVDLRRTLLHADNVITCCEANRALLARRWPDLRAVMEAKLHVCHHGLDLADFPYQPEGHAGRHVVAVARLDRDSGLDGLLRAAFLLRARGMDITVELVGDGPQRERLGALATTLGLEERVWFRGPMAPDDARHALRAASLLAYPASRSTEGVPAAVREAMCLGTPVVGSRVGALSEALADGCGLLVPPGDEASLADAIGTLLSDAGVRRRTAARARMRAEQRFDLGKNGMLLRALLRGSRRAAPEALAGPAC